VHAELEAMLPADLLARLDPSKLVLPLAPLLAPVSRPVARASARAFFTSLSPKVVTVSSLMCPVASSAAAERGRTR
jgi:hypothetical protein